MLIVLQLSCTLDFLCGHKLTARKQTYPKCKSVVEINHGFCCDRRKRLKETAREVVVERCRLFHSSKTRGLLRHTSFREVIVLIYLWNFPQKKYCTLCAGSQVQCESCDRMVFVLLRGCFGLLCYKFLKNLVS